MYECSLIFYRRRTVDFPQRKLHPFFHSKTDLLHHSFFNTASPLSDSFIPPTPGHIFIDLHHNIIRTANVPCQQNEIWADQFRNVEPIGSLPPGLAGQTIIIHHPSYFSRSVRRQGIGWKQYATSFLTDFSVSPDVAEAQRLELIGGRPVLYCKIDRIFAPFEFL